MLGAKQAINEPGPGKGKLAPLEGGVKDLERYYRALLRVSYCLFLPLGVAIAFTARYFELIFIIASFGLSIIWPYIRLAGIILYTAGASNGDKARLWWDLALQARWHMLTCFVYGLLAYIFLQALSQVQLGTLLRSENFWHGLLACALIIACISAATPGGIAGKNSFAWMMSRKAYALSLLKETLMMLYFGWMVFLTMTGYFVQAVFFLLPPFALVLLAYLRYRATGSRQQLGAMYDTLQLTLATTLTILMWVTIYGQYLAMLVRDGSVAPRPLPVGQLASGWLLPLGLVILIGLALILAQRDRIRRGLFATSIPPLPAQADAKMSKHYHQRLKWYLELEQRQPILRSPRHLAWIRLVTWLGPRAWLLGLLSSLAMVALVLG